MTLVCVICAAALPTRVEAATYGDLSYKISNGEVTITDCATSASGELVIPATIEGYPVTSIGEDAFYNCSSLTSITIPDSVTSIGSYAFDYCGSLKTVTILGEMDTIGEDAFAYCYSLNHVFFAGDEAGWDWIIIEAGNGYLQNVTRHYNCTGEELDDGVCTICNPVAPGDADGDGFVDAFDASLIQKYSVGAIDKFPIDE